MTAPITHQTLWTTVEDDEGDGQDDHQPEHLGACVFDHEVLPLLLVSWAWVRWSSAGVVAVVVVAPVDAGRVGVVDDGRAPAVGERVPGPGDERVDAGAGGVQEPGVHAEPGARRRRSRAARGGGLPISATAAPWPIIAMMPLSWYLNGGAGLPSIEATMLAGDGLARLERDRTELGNGSPSGSIAAAPSPTAYTPGVAVDVEIRDRR